MKVAADSVAHKFSDYAESVGLDFILDSRADFAQTVAFASVFNPLEKSLFGHPKETLHVIIHNPNGNRRCGISDETAQHNTNIQLHDIPVLNPAGAANSVNNLVVHRNADMTGKLPVTEKGAPATGHLHQLRCGLIHISRCDPGTQHRGELLKNFARQLARRSHPVDFVRCFDRDHSIISRLTSLKTDSAPRSASTRANIPRLLQKSLCPRPVALKEPFAFFTPTHYLWLTNIETATPATANTANANHIHSRTLSFTTLPVPPTARSNRPRMRPLRKKPS